MHAIGGRSRWTPNPCGRRVCRDQERDVAFQTATFHTPTRLLMDGRVHITVRYTRPAWIGLRMKEMNSPALPVWSHAPALGRPAALRLPR